MIIVVALFFLQACDALFEAVDPIGYLNVVGGSQSMSVEHAVERTRCRGGVVLGGNGDDFAVGYTCYAVYGFCEVIPRCDT